MAAGLTPAAECVVSFHSILYLFSCNNTHPNYENEKKEMRNGRRKNSLGGWIPSGLGARSGMRAGHGVRAVVGIQSYLHVPGSEVVDFCRACENVAHDDSLVHAASQLDLRAWLLEIVALSNQYTTKSRKEEEGGNQTRIFTHTLTKKAVY